MSSLALPLVTKIRKAVCKPSSDSDLPGTVCETACKRSERRTTCKSASVYLRPGDTRVVAWFGLLYGDRLLACLAVALVSHRFQLARLMVRQYPWLYERRGPLSWRRKAG